MALGALNEAVQAGDVHLYRVDSDSNRADQYTKGLALRTHVRLGTMNLGRDLSFLKKPMAMETPVCSTEPPGTRAAAEGDNKRGGAQQ